jgi:hypothetical protein
MFPGLSDERKETVGMTEARGWSHPAESLAGNSTDEPSHVSLLKATLEIMEQ